MLDICFLCALYCLHYMFTLMLCCDIEYALCSLVIMCYVLSAFMLFLCCMILLWVAFLDFIWREFSRINRALSKAVFYAPASIDRGHIVFVLSVCHKTLTLPLKWKPFDLRSWNFICRSSMMSSTCPTISRSPGQRSRSQWLSQKL